MSFNYIKLLIIFLSSILLFTTTLYTSDSNCIDGNRVEQGVGVPIDGNCVELPTQPYPEKFICNQEMRLIQGTINDCMVGTKTETIEPLPTKIQCPSGQVLIQGTTECRNESLIDNTKLYWPINCTPGENCTLGHADIDSDGFAYDCSQPGYTGHEGIDIILMSWEQMDSGIDVYASQSGTVLWSFDDPDAFDRCTSPNTHPDCAPSSSELYPNLNEGHTVCTDLGDYCQGGEGNCFWCFSGKNVIIIEHDIGDVFATRYDHLKSGSVLVQKGEYVARGQKIAQVGSAGNSTGPHLHFEIWGSDYYSLAEPFYGECGPNVSNGLWNYLNQPWEVNIP